MSLMPPSPAEFGLSAEALRAAEDVERRHSNAEEAKKGDSPFSLGAMVIATPAIWLGLGVIINGLHVFDRGSAGSSDGVQIACIFGTLIAGFVGGALIGGLVQQGVNTARSGLPPIDPRLLRFREAQKAHRRELYEYSRKLEEFWQSLRGVDFENELARTLRRIGYEVEATPVTGDGGVDLIATKRGVRTIIQCKAYGDSLGPAAVREIFGVHSSGRFGAQVAVIAAPGGFTSGAVAFAQENGITTWGLREIVKMAQEGAK